MTKKKLFLGVAMVVAMAGAGALPVHAASTKQYRNAAVGYAFSYPAGWTAQAANGVDVVILPSDHHAGIITLHVKGTLTAPQLQAADTKSLTSLVSGAVQGKVACTTRTVAGTAAASCAAQSKDKHGVLGVYEMDAIVHKGNVIFLFYGYDLNQTVTATDKAAISSFVGSITLI